MMLLGVDCSLVATDLVKIVIWVGTHRTFRARVVADRGPYQVDTRQRREFDSTPIGFYTRPAKVLCTRLNTSSILRPYAVYSSISPCHSRN